jgi:hypothetical protein
MYYIPILSLVIFFFICRFIWRRIWKKPEKNRFWRAYYFNNRPVNFLFLLAFLFTGCCSLGQIPTQYYFVNDSCEFYLPDYSQAVQVSDNCCFDRFVQDPPSGITLAPGKDIVVTLKAFDCSGNMSLMAFDVVLVDTIPPTFFYDSAQFLPVGMYQNEITTWHLYAVTDSIYFDQDGNLKTELYYRDTGRPMLFETHKTMDSLSFPDFRNNLYFKRSIFFAERDYTLDHVKLYLSRVGKPEGDLYVSLFELDQEDNPIGSALSLGHYETRKLWTNQNLWHIVKMQPAELQKGKKYCIQVGAPGTDPTNRVVWVTNRSGTPTRYLRYSYDAGETWGRNPYAAYLFEVWGILNKS